MNQCFQTRQARMATTAPASRLTAMPGPVSRSATGGRRSAGGKFRASGEAGSVGVAVAGVGVIVVVRASGEGVMARLGVGVAVLVGAAGVRVGGSRIDDGAVDVGWRVAPRTVGVGVRLAVRPGVRVRLTAGVPVDVGVALTDIDVRVAVGVRVGELVAVGLAGAG